MNSFYKYILFFSFYAITSKAQVNSLEISSEKEKMYSPYMLGRHQGAEGLADFRKNKPHDYLKELWYYAESFYIKRDFLSAGEALDAAMIDISRLDGQRKDHEESIVILPGFKDVIVLLPNDKLIFKP